MHIYDYTFKDGRVRTFHKYCSGDLFLNRKVIKYSSNHKNPEDNKEVHFDLVKAFKTQGSLPPNRKRDAQRKAGKVFAKFMERLAIDMIEDHTIFLLPMANGGYLYIADLNKIGRPDRPKIRKINTRGAYYVPILHRGSRLNFTNAWYYTIRFNRKNRNRLLKKALQGEKYI